jgi:hypothetical protein
MRALKVEFAAPRRVPQGVWYAGAAVFLALGVQQGMDAWHLRQQARELDAKTQQLRAERERREQDRAAERAQRVAPPPYAKDAAEIARIAAFPVEKVLARVESVQIVGVKVVSLNLDAVQGSARLELEFQDSAGLMKYLTAINAEEGPKWALQQAQMSTSPGSATLTSVW